MERDSLEKASALCSALLKGGIVPQQRRIILLHLRQLNRQLYQSLIGARRQLGDLKNSLDSLDTSLVALRYERRHLHSQIEACQDTTHLYTSIELEAAADDALENGHEAMQLRLQRELEQRQSLQGHLDRLLKSKQEAERSLTSRKRRLEELRSNLQQMLKGSKAVAVASKFDWEALKRAQREAEMIDSMASGNDRQEGKDNLSALTDLYERLVVFVSERPEFRLRFFAEAAIHIAEDGDDDAAPENDALSSANRHPNIPKAAYIQMTLDSGSHTADFFMKCSPGWLLTIESSLLPSPWTSSSSFESWALNAIKPVELSNSGEVGWLSASWLHSLACGELPEEDIAAFFETAREALQARSSLETAIKHFTDDAIELAFDASANDKIATLRFDAISLAGSLTSDSSALLVWKSESQQDAALADSLNDIGCKFRSIEDCLYAQLEFIRETRNMRD